jgi:hypothetical protein
MKLRLYLAVLALGVSALSWSAAQASTITDVVTFTDVGTYGVTGGVPGAGWNGSAVATGSFRITFDPSKLYLDKPLAGAISDLTFSVTDNRFSPATLTLNNITHFTYAYGTLDLFSGPVNQYESPNKNLTGSSNIVIGINGWTNPKVASAVWYSQPGLGDTLTTSGRASISAVPLPAALPMFAAALAGLGAFGFRRRGKAS